MHVNFDSNHFKEEVECRPLRGRVSWYISEPGI